MNNNGSKKILKTYRPSVFRGRNSDKVILNNINSNNNA